MADPRPQLIAVIPARHGSTRFPAKPLVDVGGQPMITRVIGRAQAAQIFDEIIVATDHEEIANVAKAAGALVEMTDSEIPNGTLRSYTALSQWEKSHEQTTGWMINIQGDEPFVHVEQLQKLAQLIRKPGISIATLARPKPADDAERSNPNRVKVVCDLNGSALYFSRSPIPSSEGPWLEHVGLYAFNRSALESIVQLHATELEKRERLEQLRWLEHGWRIAVGRTTHPTYAIDTPQDLIHIQNLINRGELH